ncbi:MAG: OmpA family protein [Steroidobacteraceae bacterium]
MGTWTTKLRAIAAGTAIIAVVSMPMPALAGKRTTDGGPPSKEENVGVATGLTVGALAGGPFGAVIGAAAGAWLGDRFHRESSAREAATTELVASRTENARLVSDVTGLQSSSARLAAMLDRVHELETDIGFRTEDASIPPEAAVKLYRLGTLLAALPDTQVRISGYADARGTEGYNLGLSERRAAAVSEELAKSGVPTDRLILEAHGESGATGAEGDVDAQALERRVTVRIERAPVAVAQGETIR